MALGSTINSHALARESRAVSTALPAWYGPSTTAEAAAPGGAGGGGNAAGNFQKQMAGFYGVVQGVNLALNSFTSILKTTTIQALQQEARARGDLSTALRSQAKFSAGAEFARGIPGIGGAIGGVIQAMHEQRQQRLGTEHMAKAAEVLERRIPQMTQSLDQASMDIAAGSLRIKYNQAPEMLAYQSTMLAIQKGKGGPGYELESIKAERTVLDEEVQARKAENQAARDARANWPRGGGKIADIAGTEQFTKERLVQAEEARAKYETPTVRAKEAGFKTRKQTLEEQAGIEYGMAYFRGMTPTAAPSWQSFGVGAKGVPTAAPDAAIINVNLVSMDDSVKAALKGVNP